MSYSLTHPFRNGKPRAGEPSLLLGWDHGRPARHTGFATQRLATAAPRPILYQGDGHLLTVAPTRAGKGTGVIIPNLLWYGGTVVVCDPKGENHLVTARRRREMGQRVIRFDPFGVVNDETDSLNPFDLFSLRGADPESDAQALAELLASGVKSHKEPFWDLSALGLLSGVICAAANHPDTSLRLMTTAIDWLTCDDVVYRLAVLLDTVGKQLPPLAQREIASFLQMPDLTRGGVLAVAQSYAKALQGEKVGRCLRASSFSLQDVVSGAPLAIYLTIPPDRLGSHRALLKLWVGTLLKAVLARRTRPDLRTLFLLDEAATLETFPLMDPLVTLSAGYGVWVHTFWQDLAQLQSNYPLTWKTLLNNCGVVQTFGIRNRDMATQWGAYLEHSPNQLRALGVEEQILAVQGEAERRCRRLNYLADPLFADMFDDNRFYAQPPVHLARDLAARDPMERDAAPRELGGA